MKANETQYASYISQSVFDMVEYLREKEEITRKVFVKRAIRFFMAGDRKLDARTLLTKRTDPEYVKRDVLFSVILDQEQHQELEEIAEERGCRPAQVFFQCLVDYCVFLMDPADQNIQIRQ